MFDTSEEGESLPGEIIEIIFTTVISFGLNNYHSLALCSKLTYTIACGMEPVWKNRLMKREPRLIPLLDQELLQPVDKTQFPMVQLYCRTVIYGDCLVEMVRNCQWPEDIYEPEYTVDFDLWNGDIQKIYDEMVISCTNFLDRDKMGTLWDDRDCGPIFKFKKIYQPIFPPSRLKEIEYGKYNPYYPSPMMRLDHLNLVTTPDPKDYIDPGSIDSISLRWNQIVYVNPDFKQFGVESLYLTYNCLKSIDLTQMNKLCLLDLKGNKLDQIPDPRGTKLRTVGLKENPIKRYPEWINRTNIIPSIQLSQQLEGTKPTGYIWKDEWLEPCGS